MAAHQKLDRRRVYLCAGEFRKSVQNGERASFGKYDDENKKAKTDHAYDVANAHEKSNGSTYQQENTQNGKIGSAFNGCAAAWACQRSSGNRASDIQGI
jgi:hypothetical protein